MFQVIKMSCCKPWVQKKLSIQTKDIKLFKGDVVLLCTDGLYNELGEEYLKKITRRY